MHYKSNQIKSKTKKRQKLQKKKETRRRRPTCNQRMLISADVRVSNNQYVLWTSWRNERLFEDLRSHHERVERWGRFRSFACSWRSPICPLEMSWVFLLPPSLALFSSLPFPPLYLPSLFLPPLSLPPPRLVPLIPSSLARTCGTTGLCWFPYNPKL